MGRGKSGTTTGKSDKTNKPLKPKKSKEDIDNDKLLDLVNNDPDGRQGGLVSITELRQKTNMSKEDFDKAALRLRREFRVGLSEHPHPQSQTQAELDAYVTDGNGRYFNGIAIRRN